MKSRLHIRIFGDVQGVFFRAGTQDEVRRIGGISGWVRNAEDGSVEVIAEGEKEKLEALLEWCGKGPEGAVVEKTEHEWLEFKNEFREFKVKYI
jgi:acylphosphatase